jgi:hypothetical protein
MLYVPGRGSRVSDARRAGFMIATKCPACGAEGRISNAKVNTRLVCPKCLKAFHVTSAGRSALGEPPTAGAVAPAKTAAHHPADKTQKVEEMLQDLSHSLFTQKNLIVVVCLLAVGLIAFLFSLHKGETLEDKVEQVTRAVVEGDLGTLRSLASTGTSGNAAAWYETIRPLCDSMRQHLGSRKLVVAVMVTSKDDRQGTADVIATTFLGEESTERKAGSLPDESVAVPSAGSISLPMCFRSEAWSGWHLDGTRTLGMVPLGRPVAPAPPGG